MSKVLSVLFVLALVGCAKLSTSGGNDASVDSNGPVDSSVGPFITINAAPVNHSGPSQVIWGTFCCDAWAIRRCVLDQAYPVGSGCICYGQGTGYVCQ